jgi:DeoR/GlpR family transcriptional regulator of sugar metabolism
MEKIFLEQRLNEIIALLNEKKTLTVGGLAEYFNVSGTTIRSDLNKLEAQNYVTRTHGGAIINDNSIIKEGQYDPEYKNRIIKNLELKEQIGCETAKLINDNEIIMLDDGSTTLQVAKHLPKEKKLTIITNGVNICLELSDHPNVKVISTSGIYSGKDLSFNGRLAEETTRKFHASKAILGASGISSKFGVTGPDEEKIGLKQTMIEHSDELIIVADHSKIERVSLLPVCPLEMISLLITDDKAPMECVDRLRSLGVKVIQAS